MQDLQHADCTVTPQPQPTPHGGQDQLNKHHYDLPEYDEKPSLTELIEDSTPPPYIPLTGSPPTVLRGAITKKNGKIWEKKQTKIPNFNLGI